MVFCDVIIWLLDFDRSPCLQLDKLQSSGFYSRYIFRRGVHRALPQVLVALVCGQNLRIVHEQATGYSHRLKTAVTLLKVKV